MLALVYQCVAVLVHECLLTYESMMVCLYILNLGVLVWGLGCHGRSQVGGRAAVSGLMCAGPLLSFLRTHPGASLPSAIFCLIPGPDALHFLQALQV